MNTINRLQFRHHEEVFDTREDAIEYIYDKIKEEGKGLAKDQNSTYSFSLFAEPTILRYKNDDDETDVDFKKGPHIMLVIGSETNDSTYHDRNKFCIIDIDKTEDEIKNLEEELAKAIMSLTLAVLDTNTIGLHVEKTDEGTFLSGDVKTAGTHIFEGVVKENNLMAVQFDDEAGPEGLFIYVDLTYDEPSETFTFIVSQADGTLKRQSVKLPNNYLVSGEYRKEDESLHLYMKDGEEININCEELIDEWTVEGYDSTTPIVLTRDDVGYSDETSEHHHVEPWQDVLRADVRIKDDENNILEKAEDGRKLYVKGTADNIAYYKNDSRSTVKEQLDRIKLNLDGDNILVEGENGFFASVKLDYVSDENKLVLEKTNVNGDVVTKDIELNSMRIIETITYDEVKEEIVIKYIDNKGQEKEVRIPARFIIEEWKVKNENHNIELTKTPNLEDNKDVLTADAKIHNGDNNILEDKDHTLYVKGTADNIKYGDSSNVKTEIDSLKDEDTSLNNKIESEISRANSAETKLDNKIGSAFTDDQHDNVTYKFSQLNDKVDTEIDRSTSKDLELVAELSAEIERSTVKDNEHDSRLDEQQSEIEAVSADSKASIKDVINNDHSINVDKTDATKPIISVNLSEQQLYNTIRLVGDGLYNFIDLEYDSNTNKLTLVRSDNNSTQNIEKEIQLNSAPFDISYDKTREVIIITYHTSEGDKTVEIDLHDLIHYELDVEETPSVKLEKTSVVSGPDILKANVKICHEASNAIEKHNDGIYVYSYSGEIADLGARIDTVSGDLITEKASSEAADAELERKINNETSARSEADNNIRGDISSISGDVSNLDDGLEEEIERAKNAESALTEAIRKVQIKFSPSRDGLESDGTILFNNYETNNNVVEAKVMLQEDDNIIKVGNGLYATVKLNYSAGTNTLQLVTSNGEQEVIQLAGVTFIDRCYYDSVNKNIVIVYKDGQGQEHTTTIGVSDLLNEWDVNNDGTPIKLTKTIATSGGIDTLKANVKLSEHDDNLLTIDGDALYVSGEAVSSAGTAVQCALNEIGAIEKNILGLVVSGECGNGEYEKLARTHYISDADSFMDADAILDENLFIVSGNIESLLSASGSCTPSTKLRAEQVGLNKVLKVDVTLSSGTTYPADTATGSKMEEKDLIIGTYAGNLVEPGDINDQFRREYTDTNVLRIANVGGTDPNIATVDGLYLSNYWNCGKYYQVSTEQDQIDLMKNTYGYELSGYTTDESTDATKYDYNNNVRQ